MNASDAGPKLPERIMFYGVTGSGKTTLAAEVSHITGIPFINVDEHTWLSDWVMVPDMDQRAFFEGVVQQECWIMDTAYAKWIDLPLSRVELIVALDYPRWVSLLRLLRRTVQRAVDKAPVCNGNTESWKQVFSRDSIVVWHFRSFKRKRRRIQAWARDESLNVVVHRSPKETIAWLERLRLGN